MPNSNLNRNQVVVPGASYILEVFSVPPLLEVLLDIGTFLAPLSVCSEIKTRRAAYKQEDITGKIPILFMVERRNDVFYGHLRSSRYLGKELFAHPDWLLENSVKEGESVAICPSIV